MEIGSGSGQHAIGFGKAFPHIQWQPADQGEYFEGLKVNIEQHAPANVATPVYLDLGSTPWPVTETDHIYCANVIHIMPASLLEPLFVGAASAMTSGGLLITYGPYKYKGEFTTESNKKFDAWLKSRNPLSGIRDIESLLTLGEKYGFEHLYDFDMPANNQMLVFKKR